MARIKGKVVLCKECDKEGEYYFYPNEPLGSPYCKEHARANGFCPSCGSFVLGIEIEECHYLPKFGVCSTCLDSIQDDISGPDMNEFYEGEDDP